MSKAEKLAKQFLDFGVDDLREFQRILENQGFLVGVTIVPDSWLREHGINPPNTAPPGQVTPVPSSQAETSESLAPSK